MVRTCIQVVARTLKEPSVVWRNIGLSIDPLPAPAPTDALPPDFPTKTPYKVWFYCPAQDTGFDWSEVLDLPAGQYQLTIGVDSPPGYEWEIQLNVFTATGKQGISSWTEVNNQKPASTIITVNEGEPVSYGSWQITTGYTAPIGFYMPVASNWCEPIDLWHNILDWSMCAKNNTTYQNPEVGNWLLPCIRIQYKGNPKSDISAVSMPIVAAPNQGFYPTSMFWALYGRFLTDPAIGASCPQALDVALNPYTNARLLSSSDYIDIAIYHVENDAPTLNQFWFGAAFLEKIPEWSIPPSPDHYERFYLNPSDGYYCPPPPKNKYTTFVPDVQNSQVWLQAPTDIRPGRRIILFYAFYPTPGTPPDYKAIPFICIPETHPYWRIQPYAVPVWGAPTYPDVTYFGMWDFPITQEMINKGGFTYQVGHYEVGTGTDIYLMNPIIDAEAFYSFKTGFTKPVNANITNIDLQPYTFPVMAVIKSVDLQPYEIPTPPPQTATVSGRILSMFGPVANAEVSLNGKYVTKTGPDGSFRIENVPFGTYTLTAKPTRLFPIPEKLLLKPASKTLNITSTAVPTIIMTLPLNYVNMGLIGAGTVGAVIAARELTKPKYPYYY